MKRQAFGIVMRSWRGEPCLFLNIPHGEHDEVWGRGAESPGIALEQQSSRGALGGSCCRTSSCLGPFSPLGALRWGV